MGSPDGEMRGGGDVDVATGRGGGPDLEGEVRGAGALGRGGLAGEGAGAEGKGGLRALVMAVVRVFGLGGLERAWRGGGPGGGPESSAVEV
jgi:hypothetical protein